jgi:hypothetical protein
VITAQTKLSNRDLTHRASVRKAYNTAEGRAELIRLLTDLGTFREIMPEEVALRNYGIQKLEELGLLDIEVIVEAMNWFFNLPLAMRPTIEELGIDNERDLL